MKPRANYRPFAPQRPPPTYHGIPFGTVCLRSSYSRPLSVGSLRELGPRLPDDLCMTGAASQRRSLPIAEMPPRASGDGGPSKPAANVRGGERFW